ncbi:MAG: serine/threonine-protein kinase [Planctomycetota bacterium]|nr:serine/threonine-protein kinase [Planctomycetota bacterium]
MGEPIPPSDSTERVEEIAARYLDLRRAGVPVTPQALAAAYPDLAPDLEKRLGEVEEAQTITLREAESGTDGGGGLVQIPMSTTAPVPPASTHEQVGPYRILETLGEGGMGSVYLAEQTEPVRRRVALKLIKSGLDTKGVIARFEAERQALALMDHPNIARVFDAGTTDAGLPFFVMELVSGESITDYCDRQRLDTPDRLRLFQQVCYAAQHAHQKGIIHRDLKPSNILVSVPGEEPVVKIIDFGIAKATSQKLSDRTIFTEQGHFVGTPEFMSPEQAEGSVVDIDTRTDIYSLGVILYRLLVGTLPFESRELRAKGHSELLRFIREEEPSRPSTRLSTLGKESDRVAKARKTNPSTLGRILRGDLDWITMKALEKDRTRRYGTASELAADIQRHLSHEPVLAGPPGAAYRIGKLIRRHRGPVAAAAIILFVLVAGLATSLALYFRAERAREAEEEHKIAAVAARDDARRQTTVADEARQAEKIQREEAEQQKAAAENAHEEAEDERTRAQSEADKAKAITRFLQDMLSSVDPGKDGREIKVSEVLSRAAKQIDDSFEEEPLVAAVLRLTMGKTYHALGIHDEAEALVREALETHRSHLGEMHPLTLTSMNNLAVEWMTLGKLEEAEALLRQSLAGRREVLGHEHPETLATTSNLATLLQHRGEMKEAEDMYRQVLALERRLLGDEDPGTLSSMGNLAFVLTARGKLDEAEKLHRQVLKVRRARLGGEHPHTLISMGSLASLLKDQGELDEAESLFRATLDGHRRVLGEEHPHTLATADNFALLLQEMGNLDEAEPLLRRTLETCRRTLGDDNEGTIASMGNLSLLLQRRGQLEEAEVLRRKSLSAHRRVFGAEHPGTLSGMTNLASLLQDQGKLEEAEPLVRRALAIQRRVLGEEHESTLNSMTGLGSLLFAQGKLEEAEPLLRKTLEVRRRKFGDEHPATLNSTHNLASLLAMQGKLEEAEPLLRQALKIRRRILGEDHPATLTTMHNLGTMLGALGKSDEEESLYRRALAARRRVLGEEHPDTLMSVSDLAALLKDRGDLEEAESLCRQALEARRRTLGDRHPDTLQSMSNLGTLLRAQGQLAEAERLGKRIFDLARSTLAEGDWRRGNFQALYGLILLDLERYEEAETHLLGGYWVLRDSLGARNKLTRSVVQKLVDLYTAWGKPEKAEQYRALLPSEEEHVDREQSEGSGVPPAR